MKTISVIVPAFNEEKTIGHVLQTLLDSKFFREIICVNDASTDNSLQEIQKFPEITVIDLKENKGKGHAVAVGIEKATSDVVALIDSDLAGLKVPHLREMLEPFLNNDGIDGVIAFESGEFLSVFSGQRIYRRQDLMPLLVDMKESEYGIEVLLNAAFKDKKVQYVQLWGLGHIDKFQKYDSKIATQEFIKQWFVEVLGHSLKYGMSATDIKNILNELSELIAKKAKKIKQNGS